MAALEIGELIFSREPNIHSRLKSFTPISPYSFLAGGLEILKTENQ